MSSHHHTLSNTLNAAYRIMQQNVTLVSPPQCHVVALRDQVQSRCAPPVYNRHNRHNTTDSFSIVRAAGGNSHDDDDEKAYVVCACFFPLYATCACIGMMKKTRAVECNRSVSIWNTLHTCVLRCGYECDVLGGWKMWCVLYSVWECRFEKGRSLKCAQYGRRSWSH